MPTESENAASQADASETLTDADFAEAEGGAQADDSLDDLFTEGADSEPAAAKGTDTKEQEQKSEEAAKPAESAPAKGAEKRITQLVARAKAAEDAKLAAEAKAEQYEAALEILKEQLQSKNARLQELDDISPERAELEQHRLAALVREKEQELAQKYESRLQQARLEQEVAHATEALVAKVEEAIARYPAVTKQDIAFALRRDPNVDPLHAAQAIHEARLKAYEGEILKKVKPAPRSTAPAGQQKVRKINTVDDMISALDADLGNDWNLRS